MANVQVAATERCSISRLSDSHFPIVSLEADFAQSFPWIVAQLTEKSANYQEPFNFLPEASFPFFQGLKVARKVCSSTPAFPPDHWTAKMHHPAQGMFPTETWMQTHN